MTSAVILLSAFARVLEFIRTQPLAAALWAGLALLTLSLLALMRTRWGQAKPISKCIVLSVFAHILFFGYAYGTRMILGRSSQPRDEVIELEYLDAATDQPDDIKDNQLEPEPWDRMAGPTPSHVVVPGPMRQQQTPSQVHRQAAAGDRRSSLPTVPANLRVADSNRRPTAVPQPSKQAVPRPDRIQAAELRTAKKSPTVQPAKSAGPSGALLRRRNREVADANSRNERRTPALENTKTQSRLQQLDIEAAKANAAKMAVGDDQTDRARNRALDLLNGGGGVKPQTQMADLGAGGGASDSGKHRQTTQAAQSAAASAAPRRLADGKPLPPVLQWRNPTQRAQVLQRLGGDKESEAAVERALAWLARQQTADGFWDSDALGGGRRERGEGAHRGRPGAQADTGISGLALLAFLGAGHSHLEGSYRQNVARGLNYLIRSQRDDGYLAGRAQLFARMYCHGMAMLALSEAYALTGDKRLKLAVEKAARYTIRAQDRRTGGWRYNPSDAGDMSQFGWQVMALRSAQLSGIEIPAETHALMLRFLRSASSGRSGGLASYRPGHQTSRVMTAEALTCRCFLGVADDAATVQEATRYVMEELPGQTAQPNYYYWYYATLALQQLQGESWTRWNRAMKKEIVGRQQRGGDLAGSWDHNSAWGTFGGRAYSTAMAALCLESYYRYLPLTNRDKSRTARRQRSGIGR